MPTSIDLDKVHYLLKQVNHPGRYVGHEVNSKNKCFNDSKVKTILAFPDLYEIGISNFGLKILYNIINNQPQYIADRVYAPDKDFQKLLFDHQIPLYGLETYLPIKEFDVVAFSLQYELNYTTFLGMLELGDIPLYSNKRTDDDPLIIAGGPTCFNPEPYADFVDAVIIGDGENVILELLEKLETLKDSNIFDRKRILKGISIIKGIYVPSLCDKTSLTDSNEEVSLQTIYKRVAPLDQVNHPVETPIPNISAVHDRAVIEIRRGCGRMCRFCQSCFVSLPVRERSPEEIKDFCRQSLKMSGYDEYSLLSLSTSDYQGLENLALDLNNEFAPKHISISLPSQRADNFNLELAKQIQTVRKSTLTFAPEAGSDRLRRVINKNLSEEQIINAALSAYKAGWTKIKFYFMIGLPTESYEDLDAIVDLLNKTLAEVKALKKQSPEIKHSLAITCTISIFIPKPFTPFQWFGQLSFEEIQNRKNYLINKIKHNKTIKFSFHGIFSSKLECLFAKGDRSLAKLIYSAYKDGAYLDSWTENFSREIWLNAADNTGIDIDLITGYEHNPEESLPWDFIDVGINRDWLLEERNKALLAQTTTPCETQCTNCGVCSNLKTHPEYNSRTSETIKETSLNLIKSFQEKYKYQIKLTKLGHLRYISHLDWFRLIYRASKVAELPIIFSQGFNPAPKISVGIPLGLFVESINEFMTIELSENIDEEFLKTSFNRYLPENCQILEVKKVPVKSESIQQKVFWSTYEAYEENKSISNIDFNKIECDINKLMENENIIINKKTKSKVKEINIKPYIHSYNVINNEPKKLIYTVSNSSEITIKPNEFLDLFSNSKFWRILRIDLLDKDLKSL